MEYRLNKSLEVLRATPKVLHNLLGGLSHEWLYKNEGDNTWSPHTVVGHLVFSEEVNWLPRMHKILSDHDNRFVPFDPSAQVELYGMYDIHELLDKFSTLRNNSIKELAAISQDERTLSRRGIHPNFGEVTLAQLLSTWTVHDLDHINQITRVMAKQYKEAVGPWVDFLGVLRRPI